MIFPLFLQCFKNAVAAHGDKTALIFQNQRISYAELDARSTAVARALHVRGVGLNDIVPILLPRSAETVIAILGVLKSGAAYCALDKNYPEDRIRFIIADTDAKLLLDEKLMGELEASDTSVECPVPSDEDIALLVYTSGSTGNPKGIIHPHQNLASLIDGGATLCREDDIHASMSSFSFVANTFEIIVAFSRGATLLIVDDETRKDIPRLVDLFKNEHVTTAFLPPQAAAAFLAQADGVLRCLWTGSEKVRGIHSDRTKIVVVYGSSETCSLVTSFEVDRPYEISTPIGRLGADSTFISGAGALLLDDKLKPVPRGEMGELFITGQIGRYWNRPDQNAERFLENPYATDKTDRIMYRTGDLCTIDENDCLIYNQRKDWMIKVRGYRVEPGEIEAAMIRLAPIRQAVVKSFENASGQTELFAVYTAENEVAPKDVLDAVRDFLPDYMIPAFVYQLPRLPLNANGKIDRTKIAPPEVEMFKTTYEAPANDRERTLCEAMEKILGVDRLGVLEDFVALGGNSLSAAKLQAALPDFGLSALDILLLRTPRALAAKSAEIHSKPTASKAEKREFYPLTQNQFGVYVECEQQPDSLIYNIPFLLEFPPAMEPGRLKAAFVQVIDAHRYVKTRLVRHEGEILQRRQDEAAVEIEVRSCDEKEFEKRKTAFARPFDLFGDRLYRAEIVQTPSSVNLLADFHHLIFDGVSATLFAENLGAALRGEPPTAEDYSFFDRALAEQDRRSGPDFENAQRFYGEKLQDDAAPTALFAENAENGKTKILVRDLSRENCDRSAKILGLTPANLFLSSTALVLSRFCGTDSLRFATIRNGRDEAAIQNCFGMFVLTFPVLLDLRAGDTVFEFVQQIQQDMYEILKNKDFSFADVASRFGYKPQINFAFQGGIETRLELDGEKIVFQDLAESIQKFPVDIKIWVAADHYRLTVEYGSRRFDEQTVTALIDSIAHVVQNLAEARDGRIADLSILDDAQQKAVEAVGGEIAAKSELTAASLFERCADRSPDTTALIASDRELSYRELDLEANRLANGLLSKGLRRGDRVAFLLPRDSRVLVSMLGILKAGGAYIPIDPEYPTGRINRILENSGAKFVLTDGPLRDVAVSIPFESVSLPDQAERSAVELDPDDTAYMIYTSGSTGQPKGVIIPHRGIVNYVLPETENRHVTTLLENRCRMLSVTTVSFDMFLKESFTVLMNGLTLVLADADQARDPLALADLFERTGADAFNATPTRLLQYLEDDRFSRAVASCRVIMSGGESYPISLYRQLKQKAPDAVLVNTYGPTEITVSCNAKILDGETITVGRPLWNVVESVRDHCGHPLPLAVPGELWIGGEGVAKGYHGLKEATRDRFVAEGDIRYYKSGDLARWNSRGEVAILGRKDRQIKLRGLRIELEEIETALYAIPGIKSAILRVCDIDGREHLAAWYLPDASKSAPPPSELRRRLAETLPAYMLPTAWTSLESVPTTPNGKVDFDRLPPARLLERQEYEEPKNEDERRFREIFTKILKIEKIGVLDNFFDLGGSSLLVTRILGEAHAAGYELGYGEVFRDPTPRALSELVRNRGAETETKTSRPASAQGAAPIGSVDSEGFDYAGINGLLARNTISSFRNGERTELGNILLTGPTGYLGIHFLKEFLDRETGTAYCMVRRKGSGAKKRFTNLLHYYFDDACDRHLDKRIIVLEGDLSDIPSLEASLDRKIDTVVNCAANVRHFAVGNEIAEVNYDGVVRLIEFCKNTGARLVHVSTTSVAGFSVDNHPPRNAMLDERTLWFGQQLDKAYIGSKFLAERAVLSEMASDPERFSAKIMRVGNLMGRNRDGEFQINMNSNSFVGRLRAYKQVGCIPFETLTTSTEFAPIDCTARAILELAKTPRESCVFHPYNDHDIFIGDILDSLNRSGLDIRPVEREEFDRALNEAAEDERKSPYLTPLIAYMNPMQGRETFLLKSENTFTSQILRRLDFRWPITTDDYLDKFIDGLAGLGFFDK